jgi:serine phosphatase RsbU (regulator of sigma subunit)
VDVSDLILLVLTVQAYRRGVRRDRQIAIAFAFFLLIRGSLSSDIQALTHLPAAIVVSGWSWAVTPAAIIPLGLATLVIFVRDLVDDRREKLRMSAELEAARSVQHVLIPEDVPAVPDFAIESAYQPAGEVGGDFFQILPLPGGGVLVAIGDVSGKGMPAAMTVSLLVGTVQTLAQYTQSPGEILAAMNRRMLARSNGGFTTCLVLRAERGGALTVANAGHIAPYFAGKELPLENGLPLGLSADTSYAESVFELLAGQQLTLVTDGVVEARNRDGDLFGFERTAELSTRPAEAIVQAAQAFGQEDDITALTIALLSL